VAGPLAGVPWLAEHAVAGAAHWPAHRVDGRGGLGMLLCCYKSIVRGRRSGRVSVVSEWSVAGALVGVLWLAEHAVAAAAYCLTCCGYRKRWVGGLRRIVYSAAAAAVQTRAMATTALQGRALGGVPAFAAKTQL
jgi:hypothetical protein